MKNYFTLLDLMVQIDLLRKQMVASGEENGLKSPETLLHSQELDKLIYTYQKTLVNRFREPF